MSQEPKSFGEFVRELRTQKRLGLREFCLGTGIDPSNWSKIERGKLSPPDDDETLDKIAHTLNLKKDDKDWRNLYDLAFAERGKVPSDIMSDEELVPMLPLFFRTLRASKPEVAELEKLAEKLRRG